MRIGMRRPMHRMMLEGLLPRARGRPARLLPCLRFRLQRSHHL